MKETTPHWRIIQRDGTLNIRRQHGKRIRFSDLYYTLLATSWTRFFTFIGLVYLLLNFLFAWIYFAAGPSALQGVDHSSTGTRFVSCFFFSVHTLATIGYGTISPASVLANTVVAMEALIGLLCFAVITGLFFLRFSQVRPRIVFSKIALVSELDGTPCLIFRLSNERLNEISEARVHVVLVQNETSADGQRFRRLHNLKLERDYSPLFALTWTIVHPIDEQSPLRGRDAAALREAGVEIIINVAGVDEVLSQPIHARFSYTADDLVWGGRFADMVSRDTEGRIQVDLAKIDQLAGS